jgi:hypothetical protein
VKHYSETCINNLFARDDKIIFYLAIFLKYIKKSQSNFFFISSFSFSISIEDALHAIHPKYDLWRETPDDRAAIELARRAVQVHT